MNNTLSHRNNQCLIYDFLSSLLLVQTRPVILHFFVARKFCLQFPRAVLGPQRSIKGINKAFGQWLGERSLAFSACCFFQRVSFREGVVLKDEWYQKHSLRVELESIIRVI